MVMYKLKIKIVVAYILLTFNVCKCIFVLGYLIKSSLNVLCLITR